MIIRGSRVRGTRILAAGPVAAAAGQAEFTTPGTYSWTAPTGVTSVCVVCIGGGGAGTRGTSPSESSQLRRGGGAGAVGVYNSNTLQRGGDGGLYGGGGGSVGPQMIFDPDDRIGFGGNGAVRIIWGDGRSFPSTNTANV